MARKITTEACNAFMNGLNFKKDNTYVELVEERDEVYSLVEVAYLKLHGNKIAKFFLNTREIMVSNAGWFSNTTKERLNGIPGVSICQKKGVWFLNGEEWDGSWITV